METNKISKKVAQLQKKSNERTLQSRPLSQLLEKFQTKAGTRTRDRWVPRKPIKVCTKKWCMHNEVCGLTKKLATVIVGPFSQEKRRLKTSRNLILGI